MIQDATDYVIVYRPRFMSPGRWFAWVAKDQSDAHKPAFARRVVWWPVSEQRALAWLESARCRAGDGMGACLAIGRLRRK